MIFIAYFFSRLRSFCMLVIGFVFHLKLYFTESLYYILEDGNKVENTLLATFYIHSKYKIINIVVKIYKKMEYNIITVFIIK